MSQSAGSTPRRKVLFYADHIRPSTRRDPRPCNGGSGPHEGPLDNMAVYARFGGIWAGFGDCRKCGSTVHRSNLRRPAA